MNRFRRGDDHSAAGRPGLGSTASANPTTKPSGGSSKGVHIPQDFEADAPAAGSSGSRGMTRAPLPSPSLSSHRSSPLPSSAFSAEPAPSLCLSSAGLPAEGSKGKRRMLLDADVRCEENGSIFFNSKGAAAASNGRLETRGVRLGNGSSIPRGSRQDCDVGDGQHSGDPFLPSETPPPPPPSPTTTTTTTLPTPPLPSGLPSRSASRAASCPSSMFSGKVKQRARRSPQPATRRDGNASDGPVYGSGGGSGRSAPRGGGEASSAESARVRDATPSPSFSSSSPSPPLDTIMEDHDPFEELSRAEELALTTAVASIRTAKHRQLSNREGIAITHSRLLQGDNGFTIRADAQKLLDGTRSLLQELGLEVDNDTAEPMEEEKEEEENEVVVELPHPLKQLKNSDPLDEASSASKQGAQVPPELLQAQTNRREFPSSQSAARPGGGGGMAGSQGSPMGAESPPAPPVHEAGAPAAATGEGEAGDAMDVPGF